METPIARRLFALVLLAAVGTAAADSGSITTTLDAPPPPQPPLMMPMGPMGAPPSMAQHQVDLARLMAGRGSAFRVMVMPQDVPRVGVEAGAYTYYNSTKPMCFAYVVPGEWQATATGDLQSPDGKAGVGVTFVHAGDLPPIRDKTPIERLSMMLALDRMSAMGKKVPEPKLTLLDPGRKDLWVWKIPSMQRNGKKLQFPPEVLYQLNKDVLVRIVVMGTKDDLGLSRRIANTVEVSSQAPCFEPQMVKLLNALYPMGPAPAH